MGNLFDMVHSFLIGSERKLLKRLQEDIERFMMFNKRRRWSHSSRVKQALVMSASWFLVSMDFWVQINSIKQSIKCNPVGSGHVSHRWTSALNDHLDHGFVVLKNVQLRLTLSTVLLCGHVIHMRLLLNISFALSVGVTILVLLMEWSPVPHKFPGVRLPCFAVFFVERNTSITTFQRVENK